MRRLVFRPRTIFPHRPDTFAISRVYSKQEPTRPRLDRKAEIVVGSENDMHDRRSRRATLDRPVHLEPVGLSRLFSPATLNIDHLADANRSLLGQETLAQNQAPQSADPDLLSSSHRATHVVGVNQES